MAKGASKCFFLFLLSLLTLCSSGTLVGFTYDARKNSATSTVKAISFLKQNRVSPSQIRVFVEDHTVLDSLSNAGVSVDLFLNKTHVGNLKKSKNPAISWLKTHLITSLPHVDIKNIIIASSSSNDLPGKKDLSVLPSSLKSMHSFLTSFCLDGKIMVSVTFSVSFLERLDRNQQRDLKKVLDFLEKTGSYVIVEASIRGELSMGDQFLESMIKRATLASSVLSYHSIPMVLTIKSSAVPSAVEVAEFSDKISRSLMHNTQIINKVIGLYAEMSPAEEFEQKELEREEEQMFHSSHRELLNHFHHKTISHDAIDPPTTIPTTPITNPSTAPVTIPPENTTPTIVTVPSSSPVNITPANPASTPVTVPSTTPVTVPSVNPVNSPVPTNNPVTAPITVPGAQPITNPVTTYPSPPGGIPVTTPVTNPVMPPATTNSPAVPGQSWCVAKTGASESALQAALDYACGIGGADCSLMQQGGSCYNPNSLQSHASYAFNSYYQKNPVASSCDFGGTATIVNANPSTGSCIYPTSSSSSPVPPSSSAPATTSSVPTTTSPSSAVPVSGSGSPPTVLNTSNPASATTTVFGSDSPPAVNNSASMAVAMRPFISCIILVTSFIMIKIILDI